MANIYLSCIVPTKNSAQFIEQTFKQLQAHLLVNFPSHEIIFVDDCSEDQTQNKLKQLKADFPSVVRVVFLSRPLGQHMATLAGMLVAKGQYVVTIDDDLQFHPADIRILHDILHNFEADVCYGIPLKKTYTSAYRKFFYKVLLYFARMCFRRTAFLSSFRCMKRQTALNLTSHIQRFINIEHVIRLRGIRFITVHIKHYPGAIQKSRYNFFTLTGFLLQTLIIYNVAFLLVLSFMIIAILTCTLWYIGLPTAATGMGISGVIVIVSLLLMRKYFHVPFSLQEYMKYEA